ncbi:hypothetical protein [Arthrobacter methylotrophus]|uniref:hypothetical protein n=1 Tax=Arthrobacter methylotrophus TaxID=121291 RepID=UPI0031F0F432
MPGTCAAGHISANRATITTSLDLFREGEAELVVAAELFSSGGAAGHPGLWRFCVRRPA